MPDQKSTDKLDSVFGDRVLLDGGSRSISCGDRIDGLLSIGGGGVDKVGLHARFLK